MIQNKIIGRRSSDKVNGLVAFAHLKRERRITKKDLKKITADHQRDPGITLDDEYCPNSRFIWERFKEIHSLIGSLTN